MTILQFGYLKLFYRGLTKNTVELCLPPPTSEWCPGRLLAPGSLRPGRATASTSLRPYEGFPIAIAPDEKPASTTPVIETPPAGAAMDG